MNFFICNAIFLLAKVSIGSLQHILPIIVAFIIAILFITYFRNKPNKILQHKAIHIFACFVSALVIINDTYKISSNDYDLSVDLPFHLCSLLALCAPIFTYYRKYWIYEIILFWIVGGTLQAVITPDVVNDVFSLDYYRYWFVHLGLLIIVFYATFVFNMRPTFKSVIKSFLALQVYLIIMIGVNFMFKSNYFYLNAKPETTSLLDFFGDWPWYILVGQIIIIPYFLLIYLPFYLEKRIKS
ncbi:YwaF family protein [Hyunsoonleella aestuarii]|nr:TIGR02206 family membrane protein [Hyunsoonleella aestuarii]